MQLSDLTRIHWLVIGLFGGLLLAYMWSGTTDIAGIRAADQREFERDLLLKDEASGLPFVGRIIIHPPEDSPTGKVNVVLYKRLARDKKGGVGLWLDKRVIAKIPYVPAIGGRVPPDPNMTVTRYLAKLNEQEGGKIGYRYGWWYEPGKAMAIGSVGGAVLLGGVWPTLLSLMAGAGLGPRPSDKAKKPIDWASFLRRAPSAKPAGATPPTPSPAAINDVTATYEQQLAPSGPPRSAQDVDTLIEARQTDVRKLDAGPLQAAPQQVVEAEEVEVKGEYYPVVIRHHKKPEEK